MEACKEEVFAGSELLTWARSAGSIDAGKTVVTMIFKYYAIKVSCRGTLVASLGVKHGNYVLILLVTPPMLSQLFSFIASPLWQNFPCQSTPCPSPSPTAHIGYWHPIPY